MEVNLNTMVSPSLREREDWNERRKARVRVLKFILYPLLVTILQKYYILHCIAL